MRVTDTRRLREGESSHRESRRTRDRETEREREREREAEMHRKTSREG